MVRLVSGSPAGHLALSSPYTWRFDSSSPRSKLLALESGKVPEQEGGVRTFELFLVHPFGPKNVAPCALPLRFFRSQYYIT